MFLFKKKPTLSGGKWKMVVIFPGNVNIDENYIITSWKRKNDRCAEAWTEDGKQIIFYNAKFKFEELN